MSSFQYFCVFRSQSQKPKGDTCSRRRTCALSVFVLRGHCVTPLGFCLRIILNVTHRNLKKTTFSVLSVILINLC